MPSIEQPDVKKRDPFVTLSLGGFLVLIGLTLIFAFFSGGTDSGALLLYAGLITTTWGGVWLVIGLVRTTADRRVPDDTPPPGARIR